MKAKELRELTKEELQEKLLSQKKELFNLRFQLATGGLDNPLKIRSCRRDIARINTIISEK